MTTYDLRRFQHSVSAKGCLPALQCLTRIRRVVLVFIVLLIRATSHTSAAIAAAAGALSYHSLSQSLPWSAVAINIQAKQKLCNTQAHWRLERDKRAIMVALWQHKTSANRELSQRQIALEQQNGCYVLHHYGVSSQVLWSFVMFGF